LFHNHLPRLLADSDVHEPLVFLIGAELTDVFSDILYKFRPFSAFGGRYPRETDAGGVDPDEFHEFLENDPTAARMVISRGVVAVAGMASGNYYSIGALAESLQNIHKIYSSGAWEADYPHVRVVFDTARASKIGARICAPVAHESNYLGFEFTHFYSLPLKRFYLSEDLVIGKALKIYRLRPAQRDAGPATLAYARIDLRDLFDELAVAALYFFDLYCLIRTCVDA